MLEPILFRAHHFMCTLGFQGMGYSPDFISNFQQIIEQLKNSPHQEIKLVSGLDSICAACPNKTSQQTCQSQAKITALDNAHASVLEIKAGQTFTWQEAKIRIKNKMTIEAFHQACARCEWKKLGVCEKALQTLLSA